MKYLLIDDHVLIRDAMHGVLKELDAAGPVAAAASSREAFELIAARGEPALVLLDLHLPDRDGFDVLAELRQRYPAAAVVMLSAFNDRDNVVKALDGGAVGFIPKTASRDVLLGALRLIVAGGTYIPPEALARGSAPVAIAKADVIADVRHPTPAELGLTDRQQDVLALIMQGKSNKLICRTLALAEPTVKNHVSAILKAMNVTNRTEAVLAASAMGWDLPKPERR